MFAKLFDSQKYGQVLAKLDTDEDGAPELRWYTKPSGLGVCSFAIGFQDSDEGWGAAEEAFKRAGDDEADKAVEAMYSALGDAIKA